MALGWLVSLALHTGAIALAIALSSPVNERSATLSLREGRFAVSSRGGAGRAALQQLRRFPEDDLQVHEANRQSQRTTAPVTPVKAPVVLEPDPVTRSLAQGPAQVDPAARRAALSSPDASELPIHLMAEVNVSLTRVPAPAPTERDETGEHPPWSSPAPASAKRRGALGEARLLGAISPVYPVSAIVRGEEGVVRVLARVDARGMVVEAKALKTRASAALVRAAIQAVKQARFAPARRQGVNVESRVIVPVRFTLRSASAPESVSSTHG